MKNVSRYEENTSFFGRNRVFIVMIFIAQLFEVCSQNCVSGPLLIATASIDANAYNGCGSLTSLTIPSTVTFISEM